MKAQPFKIALCTLSVCAMFLASGCDDDSKLEDTREGMDKVAEKVVDGTKAGLDAAGAGVQKAAEVTEDVVTGAADKIKEAVDD